MLQITTFSDIRLDQHCIFCGSPPDTRDHVPSKVILEKPYPENLPVVGCCYKCNNDFSLDEEYFACLIECIISGSTNPDKLSRNLIKRILERKPSLRERLSKAMIIEDGVTSFIVEKERVENVIKKWAYGHLKYENSEVPFDASATISFVPVQLLTDEQKQVFFQAVPLNFLPEVGSRAMQKILINSDGEVFSYWVTVQEGVYIYSVIENTVKILVWNYLACEVKWQ